MKMLNKLTLKQKFIVKFRLNKYQRFILQNIGKILHIIKELEICKK